MKDKEREILGKLNNFFLSDLLEESEYEYNRYDAENNHYIVEIKHRTNHYKNTMIEFDKFSYNLLYAEMNNKKFIYAVQMIDKIYVFNITSLMSKGYFFNWEWRLMPKQTEHKDKRLIKKLVGYINISKRVKEID